MVETVFYAWQSDLPSNVNRAFIRDAIERAVEAINADLGIDDAVRPDSDTQGVPGNVNVAETIFEKISGCRVFIADITTITSKDAARQSPNPNVLIEYGRACVTPGDVAVITVFNEAYGDWRTDRPFDMRHKRKPITYRLSPPSTEAERQAARKQLVQQLRYAIEACLAAPSPKLALVQPADFVPIRDALFGSRASKELRGRTLAFWCGLMPALGEVRIERPWEQQPLFERKLAFDYFIAPDPTPIRFGTVDGPLDIKTRFEPVHLGAIRTSTSTYQDWDDDGRRRSASVVANVYVNERGHVGLLVRTDVNRSQGISMAWMMADFANALRVLNAVRAAAHVPLRPYHFYAELLVGVQQPNVLTISASHERCHLWDMSDETGAAKFPLRSNPATTSCLTVGSPSDFPDALRHIFIQFETSVGRRPKEGVLFQA